MSDIPNNQNLYLNEMPKSAAPYNVVQFFCNGNYEYVRRNVDAAEACKAFEHYVTSVGARLGTTERVIITDKDDFCNAEWIHGQGLVFPTEQDFKDFGKTK